MLALLWKNFNVALKLCFKLVHTRYIEFLLYFLQLQFLLLDFFQLRSREHILLLCNYPQMMTGFLKFFSWESFSQPFDLAKLVLLPGSIDSSLGSFLEQTGLSFWLAVGVRPSFNLFDEVAQPAEIGLHVHDLYSVVRQLFLENIQRRWPRKVVRPVLGSPWVIILSNRRGRGPLPKLGRLLV